MNYYELLLTHIGTVLHLQYLIPLLVGTIAGVIGGALPGVTITMTVIVVLPFTFGLDPLQGLAAMIGVYVGGSAGGSITASLIGIPGMLSAVATTFDGFPMTKKGEAGRSVWVGVWSAFIGGALGGLCLIDSHRLVRLAGARVRAVGILRALRLCAVDGGRPGRAFGDEGPVVGRNRTGGDHRRSRPDLGCSAFHHGHPPA